ncbi:unnamed protein product [Rotaria sp. Silwood1]|nr:unnamed protein product [Rotaria sp. Silwood1]
MSRFLDIDLNDKRISLNYGYRRQSLLSLEHALEPIVPRIDHLRQYIKEALEKCHFPSEHNLTHDESASIYLYTMEWGAHSLYRLLNKDLRSENPSALSPWGNYLKLFEIALTKLPREKKRLWCGTKDGVNKNFIKGSEIIWRSVSSCSTTRNVIKKLLGNDTNAIFFMIEAVNGRNLSGYTKYPDKNEVLLGPGTRLSVESNDLKFNDGLKVVHLVEITDNNNETLPAVTDTISITSKPDLLVIWLDSEINESHQYYSESISQIQSIVNDVKIFTDIATCVNFLNKVKNTKILLVTTLSLGESIVVHIHHLPQIYSIFIFCRDTTKHEQWTKNWSKIKGIEADFEAICELIKIDAKNIENESIDTSITLNNNAIDQNMDLIDQSYMYTFLLKEILIAMKHDKRSIQEFVAYCRDSHGNEFPKRDIEQFQQEYHEHSPIWWYTAPHFLYSVLERSLKTLDFEAIIKLGFFIRDLHEQLEKLHSKQFKKGKGKLLTVYRGQGLPQSDLQKLKSHVGSLFSFNHFLSASPDRLISIAYARQAAENQESIGVLFVITVDLSISSTPFANIRDLQYHSGQELVLFSMHSVFRIERIQQIGKGSRFWQVQLTMMEHNDGYWSSLTKSMGNEIQGPTEYHRLNNLLRKICSFEKAFYLCMMPLKQTSDDFEMWNFYYQLGMIKIELGDYTGAISYFQKSIQVYEKKSAINDPHLASSYTNLGLVYANLGEYSKAISCYENGLAVRHNIFPPNHADLADSYSKIGSVYCNLEEYEKALSFHDKACEIRLKILPRNHPDLATSFSDIGVVLNNAGKYSKALQFQEKSLEIRSIVLLPNHLDLADSYDNFGLIYNNMGYYSKALSFLEKGLDIRQQIQISNHPNLADSYNNLGLVYNKMNDYSKALSFLKKGCEIRQQIQHLNQPKLADSYNNIAEVCYKMRTYPKAVKYQKQAVKIGEASLPSNHPLLLFWKQRLNEIQVKQYNDQDSDLDFIGLCLNSMKTNEILSDVPSTQSNATISLLMPKFSVTSDRILPLSTRS